VNSTKIILPTNRKFGLFFAFVFAVLAAYFSLTGNFIFVVLFVTFACSFLVLALMRSEMLLPLNKLWAQFGLLLGKIVSPIVLGIIFFGMFVPIAVILRVVGRDELRIRSIRTTSQWISRDTPISSESFKQQF